MSKLYNELAKNVNLSTPFINEFTTKVDAASPEECKYMQDGQSILHLLSTCLKQTLESYKGVAYTNPSWYGIIINDITKAAINLADSLIDKGVDPRAQFQGKSAIDVAPEGAFKDHLSNIEMPKGVFHTNDRRQSWVQRNAANFSTLGGFVGFKDHGSDLSDLQSNPPSPKNSRVFTL